MEGLPFLLGSKSVKVIYLLSTVIAKSQTVKSDGIISSLTITIRRVGGAYLINPKLLPLPQPAYRDKGFLVIFSEHWLSVSIDPMRVKGGVVHSNFLFSLNLFSN